MRFRVVTLSVLAGMLAACSGDVPPSMDGVGGEVRPPPPPRRTRGETLYDAEGVPLESDVRVAGLVLPRGLTEVAGAGDARRHVYTSAIPHQKLLRYFGPRLVTMQIEERGAAVTYLEAVPRGVRGGVVKLDVTIQPSSSAQAARVEVYERPPPPLPGVVVSEDEIRRHFDARRNQQE